MRLALAEPACGSPFFLLLLLLLLSASLSFDLYRSHPARKLRIDYSRPRVWSNDIRNVAITLLSPYYREWVKVFSS
jgi:hypothetical protein